MFYGQMLNPAYSGLEDGTRVLSAYRSQYSNYSATQDPGGSQSTQLLSASYKLPQQIGGVGLHIINDKIGPSGYTQVMGSYSYQYEVAGGTLSGGLSMGVFNSSLDYSVFRAAQPNDPNLAGKSSKFNSLAFDASLGLWFKRDDFYVGISTMHLVPAKFNLGVGTTNQVRTLYLTAGYNFSLNEDLKITPSFLLKTEGGASSIDLSGMLRYTDSYFGGLSYRSGFALGYSAESFIFLAGINLLKDKSLRFCYSLDGVGLLGNSKALAPSRHEIQLAYILPTIAVKPRPIIRTPRYRK
jgi:hypothetical protein